GTRHGAALLTGAGAFALVTAGDATMTIGSFVTATATTVPRESSARGPVGATTGGRLLIDDPGGTDAIVTDGTSAEVIEKLDARVSAAASDSPGIAVTPSGAVVAQGGPTPDGPNASNGPPRPQDDTVVTRA